MPIDFGRLQQATLEQLQEEASGLGVENADSPRRNELMFEIIRETGKQENVLYGRGVLEVHSEGFGFLRSSKDNYLPGTEDIYVSQSQIRRFGLKTGDTVIGQVRPPKEGERYLALLRVERVNGEPPGVAAPTFEALTAIYPDDRVPLEQNPYLFGLNMVAPIGLGQRGILVAPPRTGRAELLKHIADTMTQDDELDVTILLLGDRPEEIHEWRQQTKAEVIATPFDEPPSRHVQVADVVFERSRRMVERGDDVVLLVDSLSRLLRCCLAELPPSGRDIGGVDPAALHRIRRYLGSARALEEGGSLTVIGVISGDAENRLDQVLLDDLRDVVNWELFLSRDVADRGLYPAIDVSRSRTRRFERLLEDNEAEQRATWAATLTGELVEDSERLIELGKKLTEN
jgi:transcription termination factor Rho